MEIEGKIRIRDETIEDVARRVEELGGKLIQPEAAEKNWLYDRNNNELKAAGTALRLRLVAGRCLLTFKGPVVSHPNLKIREEFQTSIGNVEAIRKILRALGFEEAFTYQKQRSKFELVRDGQTLEICLDRTPVGEFLEVEGDQDSVLRLVEELGFERNQLIRRSYVQLYQEAGAGSNQRCEE